MLGYSYITQTSHVKHNRARKAAPGVNPRRAAASMTEFVNEGFPNSNEAANYQPLKFL